MSNRALHENISTAISIAAAANRTATTNGTGADLAGYRSAVALVHYATVTDGTWTATLEESDDNSAFTAVAAADQSGTFTARTSANDETVEEVSYLGSKRYVRVVVTETVASTTGALFAAFIVRGDPIKAPV
jgi:hypothetical protein